MSQPWRSGLVLVIVTALMAAGCGSAPPGGGATPPQRLHKSPDGGYVSGSTHDFGSSGP